MDVGGKIQWHFLQPVSGTKGILTKWMGPLGATGLQVWKTWPPKSSHFYPFHFTANLTSVAVRVVDIHSLPAQCLVEQPLRTPCIRHAQYLNCPAPNYKTYLSTRWLVSGPQSEPECRYITYILKPVFVAIYKNIWAGMLGVPPARTNPFCSRIWASPTWHVLAYFTL